MWLVWCRLRPEITVKAVALRKYGQEIIRLLGGRRIHPNFAVPGGVNKALTAADRDTMLAGIDDAIATTTVGHSDHQRIGLKKMRKIFNKFAVFPTGYFGLTTDDNALELYDGKIRLIDQFGSEFERFEVKRLPRFYR